MVGWVAFLVVIADGAASTELSSLFCELCLFVFDVCVLDVLYVQCVFILCVHMPIWVSI